MKSPKTKVHFLLTELLNKLVQVAKIMCLQIFFFWNREIKSVANIQSVYENQRKVNALVVSELAISLWKKWTFLVGFILIRRIISNLMVVFFNLS